MCWRAKQLEYFHWKSLVCGCKEEDNGRRQEGVVWRDLFFYLGSEQLSRGHQGPKGEPQSHVFRVQSVQPWSEEMKSGGYCFLPLKAPHRPTSDSKVKCQRPQSNEGNWRLLWLDPTRNSMRSGGAPRHLLFGDHQNLLNYPNSVGPGLEIHTPSLCGPYLADIQDLSGAMAGLLLQWSRYALSSYDNL